MEALYVFKIGGRILDHDAERDEFLQAFAACPERKILVHGGGVFADQLAQSLNIPVTMRDGRRVTDAATLDLVTMVYGGLLNKQLVARLQALGCDALGLSGADGRCLEARKRSPEPVDYGFVGDIVQVRADWIQRLLDQGQVPVFAPLTWDGSGSGSLLNSNADSIAAKISESLAATYAVSLLYCFDKPGVLLDVQDETSMLRTVDRAQYLDLKEQGRIHAGMLPKLENCFAARARGVDRVLLSSPRDSLRFVAGESYAGTLVQ